MNNTRVMWWVVFVSALISGTLAAATEAPDEALWLRYPSISPDGKTVAFSYRGDLWSVSSDGGRATQLTVHAAHEFMPVWSPDGETIAFASDRLK